MSDLDDEYRSMKSPMVLARCADINCGQYIYTPLDQFVRSLRYFTIDREGVGPDQTISLCISCRDQGKGLGDDVSPHKVDGINNDAAEEFLRDPEFVTKIRAASDATKAARQMLPRLEAIMTRLTRTVPVYATLRVDEVLDPVRQERAERRFPDEGKP